MTTGHIPLRKVSTISEELNSAESFTKQRQGDTFARQRHGTIRALPWIFSQLLIRTKQFNLSLISGGGASFSQEEEETGRHL